MPIFPTDALQGCGPHPWLHRRNTQEASKEFQCPGTSADQFNQTFREEKQLGSEVFKSSSDSNELPGLRAMGLLECSAPQSVDLESIASASPGNLVPSPDLLNQNF